MMKPKRGKHGRPLKYSTTIYIDPRQRAALTRLQARLDVSMGHLVRQAIALLLEHHSERVAR